MKKKEENKYKKIGVLHKGTGADNTSVYLAINSKKNILTAIKSIPKDKMTKESEKNFRRELQNLHNLKHPNIIQILDYMNNKTTHYIILEYCNGGNLEDYVTKYKEKNGKPLNEFFIQKILRQITPALEYMHSKNIIHRDIKLANILLNFNNYPNIPKNGRAPQNLKFSEKSLNKDFSAKITGLNFSKDLIQDNMGSTILGSPMYMSPDIVEKLDNKNTKKYNTSADLWSLGVITYELLTGEMPFSGKEVNQVFGNIEKGIYKLPNKLKASIEIISFINGLLQYYPEKRLNWEQIKEHPFLTKNVEEFNYIDLELYSEKEKKEVEINSKDGTSDNLLWIFFKCKELQDLKVDKINEKEIKEKKEIKKKIDKAKVINEEVRKATEQEKIEKEKEKEEINKLKKEAEEDKKKAELEKEKRKQEQEKLIKEENELKNKREKLIQENEKNKKGNVENKKKEDELKLLEKKIEEIKKDKDNTGQKLLSVEQRIAEAEKKKKFSEKKIQEMELNNNDNNNNELYKKEIIKLNEEKNNKYYEVEKLKKEEELKQQQYIKEKAELEKKKNEISEEKKKLENEINKNKEVKNKISDTDKQLQTLEDELKQKQQEKEKEIQKIKEVTEELKNQIEQFNKVIEEKKKLKEEEEKQRQEKEEREKEEKEKQEKDILGSFIQINKEQIEKEREQEKEQIEKEKEKVEKEKIEKEQELDDEWETISEKDVNFDEDEEIDIEPCFSDYEIVENYVDIESAKN